MRFVANAFNALGIELEEAGDEARAIRAYRKAIWWSRRWSVPWYNLGLLYKRRGDWSASLEHSERAIELNPSDEAAWWNLGIAATALGRWRRAREAWRKCGIDVPDGDTAPMMDLGSVPIRLNPATDAEVVWCTRIDPARAIILNVPLPESGHRCGDLVLHDGARNGTRVVDGVELPVFDELSLLQPSALGTFIVRVSGLTLSEAEDLVSKASAARIECEDWTANIQPLCKACSEGTVEHAHESPDTSNSRTLGVGAESSEAVRGTFEPLVASIPGAVVTSVDCALPPLPVQ